MQDKLASMDVSSMLAVPEATGGTSGTSPSGESPEQVALLPATDYEAELAQWVDFTTQLEDAERASWDRRTEAYLAFMETRNNLQWTGIQAQMQAEYDLEKAVEAGVAQSVESWKKAEKEKTKIQKQQALQTLSNATYFLKEMGQEEKTYFDLFKHVSAAMTMIKALEGAQSVFTAVASQTWLGPLAMPAATAAAMAALLAGVARVRQIEAMQPGGSASASTGGGGAVGTYAASPTTGLPDQEDTTEEAEAAKSISLSIHVYGNVVDHDAFARELVPSITKALGDGVQ